MSGDLRWKDNVPTEAGWYWVKWNDGSKTLWSFDTNDDFDSEYLQKRAILFFGPIQPPEDDNQ